MELYERLKGFEQEGNAYLRRNPMPHESFTGQLDELAKERGRFVPLDEEIHGLCMAPLISTNGTPEHLLAIVHGHRRKHKVMMFASIVEGGLEEIRRRCADKEWRQRCNVAIADLIAIDRFGPDHWASTENDDA